MQLKRQIPLLAMAALVGLAGMSGLAVPPVHAQTAQAIPVRPNPARVQQKMREIEPEYRRRVLRDGKAAADAWLVRTARQWGIEEGRRARREYDANQRRAPRPAVARAPRSLPHPCNLRRRPSPLQPIRRSRRRSGKACAEGPA